MSYSVGVKNIFELLDDENDDQPSVKTPQTKLEDKSAANAKQTQKPVKREPPVGDKPARGPRDQYNNREGGNQRSPKPRTDRPREGGDNRPRGPRPEGDRPREGGDRPRGPRPEGDRPRGPRPEGDRPRRPRPEGANTGAGAPGSESNPPRENGDRRFRGESRHHKGEERDKERWQNEGREQKQFTDDGQVKRRVYDRKSGTGRPRTENKKGGAGGANWGSETDPQQELAAETEVKEDAKAEQTEEGVVAAPEGVVSPTSAKRVEEEEEDKSISYSEYLAKKSSSLPTLPEARRAGEGVTDKEREKWATNTVTTSGSIHANTETETEAETQEAKERVSKKQTVALDSLFHIKPRPKPEREDRGRRDGDDRGRRDGDDRRRDGGDDRRRSDRPRGDRGDKFKGNKSQKPASANSGKAVDPATINDKEFPTLAVKA